MIVVAIIGIIAAIAIPRFAMLREETRSYRVVFVEKGEVKKQWVVPFNTLDIEQHTNIPDRVSFHDGRERVELHGELTLFIAEKIPPTSTTSGSKVYGKDTPQFEILIGRADGETQEPSRRR